MNAKKKTLGLPRGIPQGAGMICASDLYAWPEDLPFADFFSAEAAPWAWLPQIKQALASVDWDAVPRRDDIPAGVHVGEQVFLDPSVKLPPFATIEGPAWIGPDCQIRPSAFIRSHVIAGRGCVLGNSCEFKNALLLESVEAAHFNYVGDSVLGKKAHLGAGVILANLRLARDEVIMKIGSESIPTGLRKVGAFLGEGAEIGCNSVLQPGTIIGPQAAVLNLAFGGYLPAGQIAYAKQEVKKLRRPR